MASFKILTIAIGAVVYTLNERNGNYTKNLDSITNTYPDEMGIYDFLTYNGIVIKSILIGTVTFTVGDRIIGRATGSRDFIMNSIRINKNVAEIYDGGSNIGWCPLSNYIRYAPPVTVLPSTPSSNNSSQGLVNCPELQQIEDTIIRADHNSKLELQRYIHDPKLSLQDFLINFFKTYNLTYATLYKTGTRAGDVQTEARKRRSIGDIFKIVKEYYPSASLADVAKVLYIDLLNFNGFVGTLKCRQINKRVWWNNGQYRISDETEQDEYNLTFANWVSLIKSCKSAEVKKETISDWKPVVNDYVIAKNTISGNAITENTPYIVHSFADNMVVIINDRGSRVTLDLKHFDPSYLQQAKIKFPKGTKFKSVAGTTFKVDTDKFEDTGRNIINIGSNGGRRIVFSYENRKWATKL